MRIDPRAWSVMPAAAMTAGPTAAPAAEPNRYRRMEKRLEVLKRPQEKGLISAEAYQQKSRQILEEL